MVQSGASPVSMTISCGVVVTGVESPSFGVEGGVSAVRGSGSVMSVGGVISVFPQVVFGWSGRSRAWVEFIWSVFGSYSMTLVGAGRARIASTTVGAPSAVCSLRSSRCFSRRVGRAGRPPFFLAETVVTLDVVLFSQ